MRLLVNCKLIMNKDVYKGKDAKNTRQTPYFATDDIANAADDIVNVVDDIAENATWRGDSLNEHAWKRHPGLAKDGLTLNCTINEQDKILEMQIL